MTGACRHTDLASLAAALCQDAHISLEVGGSNWAWEPARRVLHMPKDALEVLGHDACAGIVAHEVGHAFLSRYLDYRELTGSKTAGLSRLAMNALEDPRVERWMMQRYPGVRPWLEQARAAIPDDSSWLPTLQLLDGFVREGWHLRERDDATLDGEARARGYGAEVLARLAATREARRRYTLDFCPTVLLDDAPREALSLHSAEVAPGVVGTASARPASPREAWIQVLARRAFVTASEHILHHVLAQLESDARHFADGLRRCGLGGSRMAPFVDRVRQGRLDASVLSAVWSVGSVTERQFTAPQLEAARTLLLEWLTERSLVATRTKTTSASSSCDRDEHDLFDAADDLVASPSSSERHRSIFRTVSADVDRLVGELDAILRPKRRLGRRHGYASGQRLDLARVMAFEADRRRPIDFWSRSIAPDRRSAAFLLLVDLSGSMRGPKVEHAVAGTALVAETLTRLQVPFAVLGFQDECIPVHAFGAPFDEAARRNLASLVDEPGGVRSGGHNHPAYNDDGPCLHEAAELLLARREEDRVLIVLSDGMPEGRRSNAEDLRAAVAALTREVTLIGVGLGPATEHVRDFYPNAIANVPIEELAARLAALVRERLLCHAA
ncbi:MAG: hypothetical protein FJ096_21160 [Deltaproteobacteria bacterium]|nr:hypothetical protein [Deltaproteobacteria bacterium]